MSENAVLAALRRMGIGKEEMSGHGFRAMARTLLDEVLGIRPDYIEHQLAHAVRDPHGRAYNRTAFLQERRKMMQVWADYLDQLRAGEVGKDHPSVDASPWKGIVSMDRTDSTKGECVPLRECASLQRENTRTTALFDTLKALSKLEAGGMETPCPRPGEP